MRPRRVLHLVGSPVDDFHVDLSLVYARGCLEAVVDPERYETHLALLTPGGGWHFPPTLDDTTPTPSMSLREALGVIEERSIDVVVPHLFCRPGMTSYRAVLDVLGLPYVGNPPEVMANAADKPVAKAVVAAAGVRVPEGEVLRRGQRPSVGPPAVVKPAAGDNSVGLTLVRCEVDWDRALAECFAVGERALVERYVPLGREVRCGVIERAGRLTALPLEEYAVDAETRPVRRYADKLAPLDSTTDGRGLRLTAKAADVAWIVDPGDPITRRVQDAALRCFEALGCRHYGLFDFRVDPDGEPWFLESGPYCSFAPSSVVATMAAAAGTPLTELFADMLDEAMAGTVGPTGRKEG